MTLLKMACLVIDNIVVDRDLSPSFIIAEIGQNHQGSIEIAKQLIIEAKNAGCDCVKFQKTCLESKFTAKALEKPYNNQNSWGETYGEHKKFLEFNIDEIRQLQNFASSIGIRFSASAMDIFSLKQLLELDMPFIKIGSGDTDNFEMIEYAASTDKPLVISTGMQEMNTINEIKSIMQRNNKTNYCFLHCVSSYPTLIKDGNLNTITLFKKIFPDIVIGFSGHEQGTLLTLAAFMLGAKVIERHITLDKRQKGTDHCCSLTPNEFKTLVSDIRFIENSMKRNNVEKNVIIKFLQSWKNLSTKESADLELALAEVNTKEILECEILCKRKLGKSVVYTKNLVAGHILRKEDLTVKVADPGGFNANRIDVFIGRDLQKNVKFDEIVIENHFSKA